MSIDQQEYLDVHIKVCGLDLSYNPLRFLLNFHGLNSEEKVSHKKISDDFQII